MILICSKLQMSPTSKIELPKLGLVGVTEKVVNVSFGVRS